MLALLCGTYSQKYLNVQHFGGQTCENYCTVIMSVQLNTALVREVVINCEIEKERQHK